MLLASLLAASCMQRPPDGAGPAAGAAPSRSPAPDPAAAEAAKDPPLAAPFTDTFDRPELGPDWRSTAPAGTYRIVDGALEVRDGFNHGLWLRRKLPRDFVIELDAWSTSPDGDIKLEVAGDGHTFATENEYTASGYVLIFGGWHDTLSVVARMAEHGADRKERADLHVVPGRHYHFRVQRAGGTLTWSIDGAPFMEYDDPSPLAGEGHDHFGFNDWQADLHFDNLRIAPFTPSTTPRP